MYITIYLCILNLYAVYFTFSYAYVKYNQIKCVFFLLYNITIIINNN